VTDTYHLVEITGGATQNSIRVAQWMIGVITIIDGVFI
jgi:hypothetical protein